METKDVKQDVPANDDAQQIINAIEHVDPNIVLRNLAFWLDVAIAKGRFVDAMIQKQQDNGVSSSDKDKE